MRAEEIREMSTDDLSARVRDLQEERFRLKFRSASEPLEDPLRLRVIRRDIARLQTVIAERGRGAQPVTPGTAKPKTKPATRTKKGTRT
jgi:large subunit ribosomal protein L29